MDPYQLNGTALSFIGDAVYSLWVREYYIDQGYAGGKKLQSLSKNYVSAKGQSRSYQRLTENNFFTLKEMEIFKRGRNAITHIPKNGDLTSYAIASGMEAVVGYLYLSDKERLKELFEQVFKGGIDNEQYHLRTKQRQ